MILRHFCHFSSTSCQGLVVLQVLFWLTARSQFLKNPQTTDVIQGGNVTLDCQISPSIIDDDTQVLWILKNNPVSSGDKAFKTFSRYQVEMNKEQGIYNLKIFNANYSSDNGIVRCYLTVQTGGYSSEEAKLTVLIPPGQPTINVIPQRVVQEGEKMVFNCTSVGGNPAPNISWYRNDVLLNSTYEAGANKDLPTSSELTLNPVKKEDNQAVFHCQVSSRALIGNPLVVSSHPLNVRYYPRVTVGPSNPMRLEQGTTATVVCSIDSNPGVSTVQWRRNGQLLPYTSPSLSFTSQNLVNKTDSGNYTCTANNGINGDHTGSLTLDVLYGPEVIVSYTKIIINESGSIDVKCVADANPPVTNIQWTKVGESFLSRGDNLHLTDMKRYDAGTFTCSAENQLMTSSNSQSLIRTGKADLNVIVQYPPVIKNTGNITAADLGNTANLECSVMGNPRAVVTWGRKGEKIANNTMRYVMREYGVDNESFKNILSIKEVKTEDLGDYICYSMNILGNMSYIINLREKSAPDIPKNVILVNTSYSSAFLTWDPGFDGGDPQWFFFELMNENGTTKKVDVIPENATSFEIKDLDSNGNYKVRLFAQNKISKSDASGEIQIHTKDLPYGEGDIPKPYSISFNKEDRSLIFDILKGHTRNLVDYSKLCAKVTLTINKDGNIEQYPYDGCLAIQRLPGQGKKYFVKIYNIDVNADITKAQIMFCYRVNDYSPDFCGASEAYFIGNQKPVRQSSDLPLEILIPVVVVGGLVLLVVVVILAVVFYRRKKKPTTSNNSKKDYELETSHSARPRGTAPFYPDGISNHALENHIDLDDPIIGGVYTTNSSGLPPPYTSIPDSYLNNGGLYPDSERGRKRNKSDSMDNSPDLWVKNNGHIPMDQPWDSEASLRNGYPSHTNYNDYDEDVMNRQNRNNFVLADSPYIEVSGLPDPYELDEEKSPTSNISFDDSIESGYSTPNSKAGRRVIREIIV